nr:MAG TPA: N6 adenosine methyltransferase subunit [Caudoviricetes sp.]
MAKWHYPTMTTDAICKLPVRNIAKDDTILLMWATFPNFQEAIRVIEEWGFIYKTAAFVWVKKNKRSDSLFWGMGAYTRANAEVCLIAVSKKNKATKVVKSHAVHQIVLSPIEEHSKKPNEVRERITELFGEVSKIELFARQQVENWDCWGNEVG